MSKPSKAARITTEFFAENSCPARLERIIQRLLDEKDAEIEDRDCTIVNLESDEYALENEIERLQKSEDERTGVINDALCCEIERLKQQLANVIDAIDAESELPGKLPAELLEKIGHIGVEQSMKCLVRLTKDNIKKRIQQLAEATNPDGGGD